MYVNIPQALVYPFSSFFAAKDLPVTRSISTNNQLRRMKMVRMSHAARQKIIGTNFSAVLKHRYFLLVSFIAGGLTVYFFVLPKTHGMEPIVVKQDNKVNLRTAADNINNNNNQQLVANTMKVTSASVIVDAKKAFIVYGTAWKKERTAELVEQAVKNGFRFIDTACQPKHYNEPGVGIGWKKAALDLQLDRSDIFLQTKFTAIDGQDPNNIPYNKDSSLVEQVKESVEVSLKNLQTNYLDSLVMHSPQRTIEDTMIVYRTMESFVDNDKVRRLGISNCYDFDKFKQIYDEARIKPSVLQNRLYKESNFDTELREFCKEHNIWYQSFWTLSANRHALATTEARELAKKKSLTPQTLMFAFLLQLGYVTPLSGTTSEQHMKEDIAVMTRIQSGDKVFETPDEMYQFAKLLGM